MSLDLRRWAGKLLSLLMGVALLCSSLASQQAGDYTFRTQSELVLVNVTVRDKSGNFLRGLKPGDFTILEDNKPQKVVSFDIENIDAVANEDVAQTKPLQSAPEQGSAAPIAAAPDSANLFKDRRLIVLFFDLSGHGAGRNRPRHHLR